MYSGIRVGEVSIFLVFIDHVLKLVVEVRQKSSKLYCIDLTASCLQEQSPNLVVLKPPHNSILEGFNIKGQSAARSILHSHWCGGGPHLKRV